MSEDWGSGECFLEGLERLGTLVGPDKMGIFSSQAGHWGDNIAIASYESSIKVGKSEE
jgi:hypothetical protein